MSYAAENPSSSSDRSSTVGTLPKPDGQNQPAQGSLRVSARKRTQEDQDEDDDKATKRALQDLEKSWMDRLQLISVITTFFAATEAQLISITTPDVGDSSNAAEQVANAGLSGALVFHFFAAILSFTAAFVLIRYRLEEAKREKQTASTEEKQEIWSRNPHLAIECIGNGYFYSKEPPTHLLQRFHTLCVSMTVVGFILAAAGTLCFVWSRQARSVSVFSSACFMISVGAAVAIFIISSPGTKARIKN